MSGGHLTNFSEERIWMLKSNGVNAEIRKRKKADLAARSRDMQKLDIMTINSSVMRSLINQQQRKRLVYKLLETVIWTKEEGSVWRIL